MNTSRYNDAETARTDQECAYQRAENLACLGVKSVLELCVGPSLARLWKAYKSFNIKAMGNDIDKRWAEYWPSGNPVRRKDYWLIGDCFEVPWTGFDAVVFAPPLSKGCSGRREDALSIHEVFPRYTDFTRRPFSGWRCMTLPARSFATRQDRKEFFDLTFDLGEIEVMPLTAGWRKIRKYVDVYFKT
jgi:hypothetical protein